VGSRRVVLFLTIAALAFAGCGGDDDENGSEEATETVDTQLAIEQDRQAQADARNLVALVETCFVDVQDYTQCPDAAGGEDVGQATVEAPSATEFVVTAPSESGNEFVVAKTPDGGLVRTCEEPGEGDCGADGTW
jgi:hypothetical protein